MAASSDGPCKGFRDRAAHDRAHELLYLPEWHPDAPKPGMRHVLKRALRLCLTSEGYCDYEARRDAEATPRREAAP